ncbi:MAG: MFS transporter [Myxococcota bacterium]
MAFLRNRAVNWINLHSGIQALAQGMGGVFVLVFLLRAGISIPVTLCAIALIFTGRFVTRPVVLASGKRWGLKPLVVFGCLVIALQYPLLAEVHGVDRTLLAYCLISALGDTFYWSSYHAYFALLGDSEHRGHQIGAGVALSAIVGIVAPLLGAWSLVHFGPRLAFGTVGVVQALAAAPLLATPNVFVPPTAPGALRSALLGVSLFATDGWFSAAFDLVWQIALFLSLGQSLSAYGGAMALAALVGAVSGMLLGRHIDRGNGLRALGIAYPVVAATLALRAVSLGTPWLAVAANAFGALAGCLQRPVQMTPVYNLGKASPCALRFMIAAEGGWDVGCVCGCLAAAALVSDGISLSAVISLAVLGLAAQALLLGRYYSRSAAAVI